MKNDELFDAIVTDRIRLRCVNRDDASVLVALMTPGVSRWLASWPADLTEAAVIAKIVEARTAIVTQQALHFLIERRADQAAMGWIRVSRLTNRSRRGDLSYWLNET